MNPIEEQAKEAVASVMEWPRIVSGLTSAEELGYRAKLAAKLSKCYLIIERVLHDDTNQAHKYSFASAETIYKACRGGMEKAALAIIPFMGDYKETPISKPNGERSGAYMVVDFDFLLIDCETGYGIPIPWRGEVMEYGDKGFNKGATNATKYLLRTLFLLPTDKDEEVDHHGEEGRPVFGGGRQAPGPAQNQKPKNQAPKPAPASAKPGPEKTPEEKEFLRQRNENMSAAYPALGDKNDLGYELDLKRLEAFKEAAKAAGLDWAKIIVELGPRKASHFTYLKTVEEAKQAAETPKAEEATEEPQKPAEAQEAAKEYEGEPVAGDRTVEQIAKETDALLKMIARSSSKLKYLDMASGLGLKLEELARIVVIDYPEPSLADFEIKVSELMDSGPKGLS